MVLQLYGYTVKIQPRQGNILVCSPLQPCNGFSVPRHSQGRFHDAIDDGLNACKVYGTYGAANLAITELSRMGYSEVFADHILYVRLSVASVI